MRSRYPRFVARRSDTAFSLVEIALALGIIAFALIGIVGALPLAMNNGRLSIAQSRAASIADTMYANFRTQPFSTVQYLDQAPGASTPAPASYTFNLNTKTKNANDNVTFYAAFDEAATTAPLGDARRLHFVSAAPGGGTYYTIVLRFDNSPPGLLAPYQAVAGTPGTQHAQGNNVDAYIFEVDRPNDVFRFSSLIANRSE